MFSAGYDQRITGRLSARLGYEWYDEYFVTQDNAVRGGDYDLWNLRVTYRPGAWRIDAVNLAITNLFDNEYYYLLGTRDRATHAVPGVPIQARLSIDWRF
jgi:outer membrane receptor protein involved in Fe transport